MGAFMGIEDANVQTMRILTLKSFSFDQMGNLKEDSLQNNHAICNLKFQITWLINQMMVGFVKIKVHGQ
jgi:hypothetical protein